MKTLLAASCFLVVLLLAAALRYEAHKQLEARDRLLRHLTVRVAELYEQRK